MVDLSSILIYFEVCSVHCWLKMGRGGDCGLVYLCLVTSSISGCTIAGLKLIFLLFIFLQNPHVSISDLNFTVGQARNCNLWLKDPTVGNVLCKLSYIEVEFLSSFLPFGKLNDKLNN